MMLQTRKEICDWLDAHHIKDYFLNEDLSVHAKGDVILYESLGELTHLPIQFDFIAGNFDCSRNSLTSLIGGPRIVNGHFLCSYNLLLSLEHGPVVVHGNFNVSNNKLTSLKGAPTSRAQTFWCHNNFLTTLDGAPKITQDFDCSGNNLVSLIGGPHTVYESLFCYNNELTSLEGAPEIITLDCFMGINPITSLHNIHHHIKHIGGILGIEQNIESNLLGVFRIKGLQVINTLDFTAIRPLQNALKIINANLEGKGNIHTAQEQLLDAGLKEFAQL